MMTHFCLRVVDGDYYLARPAPNIDVVHSAFRQAPVVNLPVLRLFGTTPAGQKACLHVHNVFPYFYVALPGNVKNIAGFCKQFALSLDLAVQVSLGKSISNQQHYVYSVEPVKRIPLYGFYEEERDFLKVYLYNPALIRNVSEQLVNGTVMNMFFQPYQTHIPFILQFFIDYNLHGMNYIYLSNVYFRRPLAEHDGESVVSSLSPLFKSPTTPTNQVFNSHTLPEHCYIDLEKKTRCSLELDAVESCILNKANIKENVGTNPGLNELWEGEKQRRRNKNECSIIEQFESQDRGEVVLPGEQLKLERLKLIVEEKSKQSNSTVINPSDCSINASNSSFNASVHLSNSADHEMLQMLIGLADTTTPLSQTTFINNGVESGNEEENEAEETILMSQTINNLLSDSSGDEIVDNSWSATFLQEIPQNIPHSPNDTVKIPQLDGNFDESSSEEFKSPTSSSASRKRKKGSKGRPRKSTCFRGTSATSMITGLSNDATEKPSYQPNIQTTQTTRRRTRKMNSTHSQSHKLMDSPIDFTHTKNYKLKSFSNENSSENYSIDSSFDSRASECNVVLDDMLSPAKSQQTKQVSVVVDDIFSSSQQLSELFKRNIKIVLPASSNSNSRECSQRSNANCAKQDSLNNEVSSISKKNVTSISENRTNNDLSTICDNRIIQADEVVSLNTLPKEGCNEEANIIGSSSGSVFEEISMEDLVVAESENDDDEEPVLASLDTTSHIAPKVLVQNSPPLRASGSMIIDHSDDDEQILLFSDSTSSDDEPNVYTPKFLQNTPRKFGKSPTKFQMTPTKFRKTTNIFTPPSGKIKSPSRYQNTIYKSYSPIKLLRDANKEDLDKPCSSKDRTGGKRLSFQNITVRSKESSQIKQKKYEFFTSEQNTKTESSVLHDDSKLAHGQNLTATLPDDLPSEIAPSFESNKLFSSGSSTCQSQVANSSHEASNNLQPLDSSNSLNNKNASCREEKSRPSHVNADVLDIQKNAEDSVQEIEESLKNNQLNKQSSFKNISESQNVENTHRNDYTIENSPLEKSAKHGENQTKLNSLIYSVPSTTAGSNSNQTCISTKEISSPKQPKLVLATLEKPPKTFVATKNISSQQHNLVVLTPLHKPPSRVQVLSSLLRHDLCEVDNNPPIYSKQADRVNNGPRTSSEKGVHELPIFESKVANENFHTKLDRQLSAFQKDVLSASDSCALNRKELMNRFWGGEKLVITPCIRPPTFTQVENFLERNMQGESKRGDKQKKDKEKINETGIEGISENENSFGFALDSINANNNSKSKHMHQHLTIVSVELHIETRRNLKPDPTIDPIVAIFYSVAQNEAEFSTGVYFHSKNKTHLKFTSPNLSENCFSTETDMLNSFAELIQNIDPDFIIGYEVQMLSIGYLIERGAQLDMNMCHLLSRMLDAPPSGGGIGGGQAKGEGVGGWFGQLVSMQITGRIIINTWRVMRSEVTLQMYSYENVCYHVLKERVPAYMFRSLTEWWRTAQRWRVVQHFVNRCRGSLRLLEKIDFINRTSELARVFGILFYSVISRGSQYRVESMMLRVAKPLNFIPVSPHVRQRAKMAAPECIPLVMEPQAQFYSDPVIVLDFQSLYPSIIIAYNYCYSTCLGTLDRFPYHENFDFGAVNLNLPFRTLKKLVADDSIHISPNDVAFVKQSIRTGILPRMLEEILSTRIMVKTAMKKAKADKTLQKMLDSRQLGLKLIANVTYGYTGANFSGRMPCVEIADSVVRKGRETLERAIHHVNTTKRWNAQVVYGDTDSLFVLLKGASKEKAFQVSKEMVDEITAMNPKPVKLKFEKVYKPCVLVTKKRYVGYMYESVDQMEPVFDAKGIETVRRDNCPAVNKMMEKCIRLLFETNDLSLVKQYTQRQFTKIMSGKVTLQDFIFAKEYRGMASYKPGACVPALTLTKKALKQDSRSEPRVGERVPYVIVHGSPGSPLIQLVKSPHEVLSNSNLRLNDVYYITKQICPALGRIFSLLDVDVTKWYSSLPRVTRVANFDQQNSKKGVISQYFCSNHCLVCGELTNRKVCEPCRKQPQNTTLVLLEKCTNIERRACNFAKMCLHCSGANESECISIECPIRYKYTTVRNQISALSHYRDVLEQF